MIAQNLKINKRHKTFHFSSFLKPALWIYISDTLEISDSQTASTWVKLRIPQQLNLMKLLPICFGHPQRTMGTDNFARFGALRLFSHIGDFSGP